MPPRTVDTADTERPAAPAEASSAAMVGASVRAAASTAATVAAGYGWSAAGVAAASACFWVIRGYVDKGQASLLYLPVVIACATRFGFGPAVLAALLAFGCWNFFFLPPYYTFTVHDPKDWLSLFVFLLAAVTTGRLAARAREEAEQARARETEVATLFEASEALSRELSAGRLLAALASQVRTLCRVRRCLIFRPSRPSTASGEGQPLTLRAVEDGGESLDRLPPEPREMLLRLAELAAERNQVIGFGPDWRLWAKAVAEAQPDAALDAYPGVFVPLHAADSMVGVLHVGPRTDGQPFGRVERRLILTLANHAATAIAREGLAEQAAQATALREADTLKDALLSMVSHELRTPLAAIKASVTGLMQRRSHWDESERVEALAAIDGEADRLTGLVNNLLDLSRLESGAWKPLKDWCDLADVLGTVLDRLPDATASRVETNVAPDLPLIRADYTQIALVVENLLGNAAKYAPEGRIVVRMTHKPPREAGEEPRVLVSVRDYGPGIAPGEEKELFGRFFRGKRHRGGAVHGSGLGLALCDAIVRAHGGEIRAENAPVSFQIEQNRGAMFTFWLPAEPPSPPSPLPQRERGRGEGGEAAVR